MTSLQQIPLKTITGGDATLGDYAGKVLLIVNVASQCGLTPQYDGLEQLHESYAGDGFEVLGFPANNFREQEPGTDAEIAEFCNANYGVQFPLFSKISIVGPDKHPLYKELIAQEPHTRGDTASMRERFQSYGMTPNPEPEVLWNFEKFLVGRDGTVKARFAPATTPQDPDLIAAIEDELAAAPVA